MRELDEQIFIAIRDNNVTALKKLITDADLNTKNDSLICAASMGRKDCAEILIKNGANINVQNDNGSPLTIVCVFGRRKFAELLIQYGANIDAQSNNGSTPMSAATGYGKIDLVALLMKHGAAINDKALGLANLKKDICAAMLIHHLLQNVMLDINKVIIADKLTQTHFESAYRSLVMSANTDCRLICPVYLATYMSLALGCDTPIIEALVHAGLINPSKGPEYFKAIRVATTKMPEEERESYIRTEALKCFNMFREKYNIGIEL